MSVFILGIGVIAIASLLPAGIKQQQNSRDISAGPVVAQAAIGLLRSKFSPSDFGGDDFAASCNTPGAEGQPSCFGNSGLTANYFCNSTPGDFNWTRPARWAPPTLHPKGQCTRLLPHRGWEDQTQCGGVNTSQHILTRQIQFLMLKNLASTDILTLESILPVA